jgi:signal transduction histidine kinase
MGHDYSISAVKTEKALVKNSFADDLEAIARIDAIPNILEVVCRTTGMGFAAVARVTEERWIACAVRDEIAFGLQPGGELQIETTICNEIRDHGRPVVINHASEDDAFCNHPTPKMYGFQSYISVPIFCQDGRFFGTLCAIDPKPAIVNTPATIGMFRLFAELVAFHLDAQERVKFSEKALLDERHTAQLREQFIAVLGHDLRNPLNAITGASGILLRMPLAENATPLVAMVQRSASRMAGLIDNVLDFARGRLGGGLSLKRARDLDLKATLEHVIAEAKSAYPERVIESDIVLTEAVSCDGPRIAQMFSNLLTNALTHGSDEGPIIVHADTNDGAFTLSVTNPGEPIAPAILEGLFQPFSRSSARPDQQGLGLGLYIASEIARAHDGRLEVSSLRERTRFTFSMHC